MNSLFLHQIVKDPTRKGKNILDIILTNNEDLIHSTEVTATTLSDHDLVSCFLINNEIPGINGRLRGSCKGRVFTPKTTFDSLDINKANWEQVRSDFLAVDWTPVKSAPTQDLAWAMFSDTVANVCARNCPKHKAQSRRKNIPRDRRLLLRKKRKLLARIKAMKSNVNSPQESLENAVRELGEIELKIGQNLLERKSEEEIIALNKIKKNPKAFFSFANRHKVSRSGIGPLKDHNGDLQSDPELMANILQDQYKSVFSIPQGSAAEVTVKGSPKIQKMDTIEISPELISRAIKEAPANAAPGPDKFPVSILKECSSILAPVMAELWKSSMASGDIAGIFKQQSIIPIFKKNDRGCASNYRPVSLTSNLAKTFERVIRTQMTDFFEKKEFFHPDQHGSRSGRSCFTQLIHHIDDVLSDLGNGANVDTLYIDMSKAYDKVSHRRLLEKLRVAGIDGQLLNWIEHFLTGRTQTVIVEGTKSYPTTVLSGVPQGTVLASLLFLVYMNDLPAFIKHCKVKMFVDDAKLQKPIRSSADRDLLLDDLHHVKEWANENQMELNEKKFQLLQHGTNGELKQPYEIENGIVISGDDAVRDLGVLIDPSLSWKAHIAEITRKASTMASWILRTFRTREKAHLLQLYKAYVLPHLEYCSALWCPYEIGQIEKIEAVQRSFTAQIHGCKEMGYWERLAYLDLYSLQRRRERFKILAIWKIQNGLVPNHYNIVFRNSVRHGPTAERPIGKSSRKAVNTTVFNGFTSSAIGLYNSIPATVKTMETFDGTKSALDRHLSRIPDQPPTKGYPRQNNNGILDWSNGSYTKYSDQAE